MSWTSEFEPPPPRPNVEVDETAAEEAAVGEASRNTPADGETAVEETTDGHRSDDVVVENVVVENVVVDDFWADSPTPVDIPDDGPLDPSIFDGLFADLTPAPESAQVEPTHHRDGTEPAEAVDLDQLEDHDSGDGNDHDDKSFVEDGFEVVDTDPGNGQDGDFEAEGVEDPGLEVEDPGLEGDEDPEFRELVALDDAEPPEAAEQFVKPAPPVEPTPRHTNDAKNDGFDPEETLFEVELESEAARDESGDLAAHVDDIANGSVDSTSTISVNGQAPLEPFKPHHPLQLPKVPVDEPAFSPSVSPGTGFEVPLEPQQQISGLPQPHYGGSGQIGRTPGLYTHPPRRRWRSFLSATLIGAGLGIGGAVVLSQIIDRSSSDESSTPATTAGGAVVADPTGDPDSADRDITDLESDQQAGAADVGTNGAFSLNNLRFEPGSLVLTEAGQATLTQVAAATTQRPNAALSIVVRTYSEESAAANLELSRSQAQVLVDGLIGLGVAPEAVTGIGIGAPTLNPSQPVPNFVVVGAGLQSSALKSAIKELSPFAIGVDPRTNQLRQESIGPLTALGQAMTTDPASSISLAAYAYDRAGPEQNQALAGLAADAAAAFLLANHEVDPSRIALLTPGQAPYVVAVETGNHISIQWGDQEQTPMLVTEADQLAISFAPGSVLIEAAAADALDRVAEAATNSEASIVAIIHTETESDDTANSQLSERQAAAVADHLTQAGLGDDRVTVYSGGNLRQFSGGEAKSRVVITPVR